MTVPALFVDPVVNVAPAATLLSENDLEGLLVADEDGWYGILTTADTITVRDIMTPCPPTADPSWPLASCVSIMNRLGTRCLPVADQEGCIIAVVAPTAASDAIKYHPHTTTSNRAHLGA